MKFWRWGFGVLSSWLLPLQLKGNTRTVQCTLPLTRTYHSHLSDRFEAFLKWILWPWPLHSHFMKVCTSHIFSHTGITRDGPVWFVITEASTKEMSELLGVNFSPSLAFVTSTKKAGFRMSYFNEGRLSFDNGYVGTMLTCYPYQILCGFPGKQIRAERTRRYHIISTFNATGFCCWEFL